MQKKSYKLSLNQTICWSGWKYGKVLKVIVTFQHLFQALLHFAY